MSKWTTQNANEELIALAIAGIDAQIQELQKKKESLLGQAAEPAAAPQKRGRKPAVKPSGAKRPGRKPGKKAEKAPAVKAVKGRPRKVRQSAAVADATPARKKRMVSPETRKRLKESATARWAREKSEQESGGNSE